MKRQALCFFFLLVTCPVWAFVADTIHAPSSGILPMPQVDSDTTFNIPGFSGAPPSGAGICTDGRTLRSRLDPATPGQQLYICNPTEDGYVLVGDGQSVVTSGVGDATGNINQVRINGDGAQHTGSLTLSLPQNFDTNASPAFSKVTLDGIVPMDTTTETDGDGTIAILELRNSTTTRESLRVYSTYTSATNYERFEIGQGTSTNFDILTGKGSGGGSNRGIRFGVGGSTPSYTDPDPNWQILASGISLLPFTSNTTDLGATDALPGTIYAGTSIILRDPNGAQASQLVASALASGLSGATVTMTGLIPIGALVDTVICRVNTLITGATSFNVGDGIAGVPVTAANQFCQTVPVAATTQCGPTTATAGVLVTGGGSPRFYGAATDVVLTAVGGNFSAGAVRCVVYYKTFTAPTS